MQKIKYFVRKVNYLNQKLITAIGENIFTHIRTYARTHAHMHIC